MVLENHGQHLAKPVGELLFRCLILLAVTILWVQEIRAMAMPKLHHNDVILA